MPNHVRLYHVSTYPIPDLVMAWGQAWAISRGAFHTRPDPRRLRVEVDVPGHRVRHVLHTYDADSLGRLRRGGRFSRRMSLTCAHDDASDPAAR